MGCPSNFLYFDVRFLTSVPCFHISDHKPVYMARAAAAAAVAAAWWQQLQELDDFSSLEDMV